MAKNNNVGVEFSFGLQRAEVVGALINGIALLALSFTLIIEAIQRFVMPEVIGSPWLVLYVGSAGLFINCVGIFLFHGHSHHGHGHEHAIMFDENDMLDESRLPVEAINEIEDPTLLGERVMRVAALMHEQHNFLEDTSINDHDDHASHSHDQSYENHNHSNAAEHNYLLEASHDSHDHHSHDLNMHGIFLHILGDLLASFGVISSALVIIFVKGSWTVYMDPVTSIFITAVIIFATVPLVRSACYILLQRTPSSISVDHLRQDILKIPGGKIYFLGQLIC